MTTSSGPGVPAAVRRVLNRRLAAQRLTAAGLTSAAEVVRLLCCVQSQEPISAAYSLGLRVSTTRAAPTLESVRAEIDAGSVIRTHILRPTWHFVSPEDVRWILALTSPRVEQGMGARHRQLQLDDRAIGRGLDGLAELLSGNTFRTRRQLGPVMAAHGIAAGEQLGHLLLISELRGLICSGPTIGGQHSYALLDERVPPTPELHIEQATAALVHRFLPGTDRHRLTIWCAGAR